MSAKKLKCTVSDGRLVDACHLLRAVTEYGNPRGKAKGIYACEWYKLGEPANHPHRRFFIAKSGEYVKGGMVLNYCPMCGEKINAPVDGEAAQGVES